MAALEQRDPVHKPAIDIDTPADKTLKLLERLMKDSNPSINPREVIELRDAIMAAGDLRQPVNFSEQLMKNSNSVLDNEVSQSLIQLLSSRKPGKASAQDTVRDTRGGGRVQGGTHNSAAGPLRVRWLRCCLQPASAGCCQRCARQRSVPARACVWNGKHKRGAACMHACMHAYVQRYALAPGCTHTDSTCSYVAALLRGLRRPPATPCDAGPADQGGGGRGPAASFSCADHRAWGRRARAASGHAARLLSEHSDPGKRQGAHSDAQEPA